MGAVFSLNWYKFRRMRKMIISAMRNGGFIFLPHTSGSFMGILLNEPALMLSLFVYFRKNMEIYRS
jgi:hypothetical protein